MENISEKIYDKVIEIAEMTAKHEQNLSSIDNHLKKINNKIYNHNERIKKLEIYRSIISGIIIAITIIFSILWTFFTFFYKN